MKKLLCRGWVAVVAFAPALAFAQNFGTNGFFGLLDAANTLINRLIPFIIALTVLVFLWGVFKFVISNDAEARKEARSYMVWGIVSLFIMVSVWGLVNILVRTFSLNTNAPALPQVPTTYTSS
jgi:uncharacterized membrane protein YidH (DUF202 family)